jgi:hypothetical protein
MVTTVRQSSFEDLVETLTPAKVRDGWCHNDMIFSEQGKGYGVADSGATVCLGNMATVELYIKHGIDKGLKPIAIEILDSIKDMEERDNGNQPKIIRTGDFRSRPSGNFEHRKGTTRRSSPTKRTPLHPSKLP